MIWVMMLGIMGCKHLCLHFSEEPVGNHVRARTYVRIRT